MELSIKDIRAALNGAGISMVRRMSDSELKQADFLLDLEMNRSKVFAFISRLEQNLHILLPNRVMDSLQVKNTVAVFITAANHYLVDLNKS